MICINKNIFKLAHLLNGGLADGLVTGDVFVVVVDVGVVTFSLFSSLVEL